MAQINSSLQLDFSPSDFTYYTHADIIYYLNNNWSHPILSLEPLKKILLDIDTQSLSIPSIIIAGTNGKTITNYFLATLLNKENITVASFTSPHFTAYNEQITANNKQISNDTFTKHAITLLNAAAARNHTLHSHELLFGITLLHAREEKIDLLLLEQKNLDQIDPVQLLTPRVVGVTRLIPEQIDIAQAIDSILTTATPSTFIISADQNKANLLDLSIAAKIKKAHWLMPIRKVACLAYPYEQLHGRCATLAERIACAYLSHFSSSQTSFTLLQKPKKHRGRPSLALKKQEELQPYKTIDQFWAEFTPSIPGRFELLKIKAATILLDCADSIDAFKNLLLGIRLLAYKEDITSITIIIGSNQTAFNHEEFIKLIRYFFKKNNGNMFFCPLEAAPHETKKSWNPEQMCNIAKNIKIKSESFNTFKSAFSQATKQHDPKHLIVVTGDTQMITEYLTL